MRAHPGAGQAPTGFVHADGLLAAQARARRVDRRFERRAHALLRCADGSGAERQPVEYVQQLRDQALALTKPAHQQRGQRMHRRAEDAWRQSGRELRFGRDATGHAAQAVQPILDDDCLRWRSTAPIPGPQYLRIVDTHNPDVGNEAA